MDFSEIELDAAAAAFWDDEVVPFFDAELGHEVLEEERAQGNGLIPSLERALAEAGFVLEVTRVVSIEEEVEIRQWEVETRHGPRAFQTHLDDWPRTLPEGGLLIRDVAGDLYRLTVTELDKHSRELLWAFVD